MTLDEKVARIKVPTMPTKDELFDYARRHLKLATPTYLEAWPDALRRLSIAQVGRELTVRECNALMWFQDPETFQEDGEALTGIESWIDSALVNFPNGGFVRLGSRSPKDSYLAFDDEGFKILTGRKALDLFSDSIRIFEDLNLAGNGEYTPWIFIREWKDIPEWTEFRCFMRDRKLIGMSQYYYQSVYPELDQHKDVIQWGIERFFQNRFLPVIHMDHVVFDVFVSVKERHSCRQVEVKLLEINPFGPWTDPCLFSWLNQAGFDGTLRYMKPVQGKLI